MTSSIHLGARAGEKAGLNAARSPWLAGRVAAALAVLLGLVAATAPGAARAQPSGSSAQVRTVSGDVEGLASAGVVAFRGLPYAAAPVGELRWHRPRPPAVWSGVRRADAFGKACPQRRDLSIDQAGDPGPVDEDCLFLNVWTPRPERAARLPVLVWIHGGAFVIGAGTQALFDGSALARRDAVVVTFNYRLGTLGFFSHPALDRADPGGAVNFGLLDQIAALRWVRDNIAAFGGDPDNVTIFGESAGAQSVLALFVSPPAQGLFHKGIAQSAYGLPSHSRTKAREVGVAVATAAGLPGARATLAQLRALPAAGLPALQGKNLSLSPSLIVGDAALPGPILAAFQQGREARVPLIIGSNDDEASVAVAFGIDPAKLVQRLGAARIAIRPLYEPGLSDSALGRGVVRDVVFTAYPRRIAYLHSERAPTWRYYFSRVPSGLRAAQTGVPHGGEIASVFGVDEACRCLGAPLDDADRALSRQVGDLWVGFARGGIPEAAGVPAWPRDGRREARVLELGDEPLVRDAFMQRRLNTFIGALNLVGGRADR